jgi:GntR family transcriptional regulator
MIDRQKHIPLYIQLKEELCENIKLGVWEVDTQIPTEKDLVELYEVGRATVREAVSRLVNEGYLYKKQGIGTFVARKQPSIGFEPLISLTYSLKARGITEKNIISKHEIIVPDKSFLNVLKWKNQKNCFHLKRIRYAENLPVAVENSFFCERFKYIVEKFDVTNSLARIIIEDLEISINKVTQDIVSRVPTKQEQEELKVNENEMVLEMQRWIYANEEKEPFYYLHFVMPGNLYSFPIENL